MEITAEVSEAYQYITGKLSLNDRLRLAALLLNDVTRDTVALIEKDDTWTSQDQTEISTFALSYAADIYAGSEELV